jgi:hypothetical protein
MTDNDDRKYQQETKSSDIQLQHREELYRLYRENPIPVDELTHCFGLYMRSSALSKILFLNEVYNMILDKPGVIMEFGVWWGQNIVVFENLRAIYEPFNASRRVIGFDTFSGYPEPSKSDKASEVIKEGGYSVSENYFQHLEELITFHEKNNVLGAVKKHTLVKGNIMNTLPDYLENHPETVIALAYFDMALYEPTAASLTAIRPYLIPGSVIMLDEFNNPDYPGETIAFRETFSDIRYSLKRSQFMPDRTFIIIE